MIKKWFYGCITAFQFLTRIPIPLPVPYEADTVRRSLPFYPLAGTVIGAVAFMAAQLLPTAAVPLNAAVLLLLWTLLTGGLHLDGWMDSADAFGSHRDRGRMLEIMKDSRVGAMGVLAAVFLLLFKWIGFWLLLEHWTSSPSFGRILLFLLISIPTVSRWWMVAAIIHGPYIGGAKGLGSLFAGANKGNLAIASIWPLLISLLASLFLLPSPAWIVVTVGQLTAGWLAGRYVLRKLGGWTGDTYGALNEFVEATGFIIAAYMAAGIGG